MDALTLTLVLSLPPIIVATVVGIVVSLLQALTQIQEQTLSFAVKLICVTLVLNGTAGWFGGELVRYTQRIFDNIGKMGRRSGIAGCSTGDARDTDRFVAAQGYHRGWRGRDGAHCGTLCDHAVFGARHPDGPGAERRGSQLDLAGATAFMGDSPGQSRHRQS